MANEPTKAPRTLSDIRPPSRIAKPPQAPVAKPAPVKTKAPEPVVSEPTPAAQAPVKAATPKKSGGLWRGLLYTVIILLLLAAVAAAYWYFFVKKPTV